MLVNARAMRDACLAGGLFMPRRIALALAYVGGAAFFLAGVWTLFDLEFVCLGGCVPADVPNKVIGLVPYFAPFLAPGIVMMVAAWIICLVLLRRAHWQGWFRTALAVPVILFTVSAIALIATWDIFAQTSALYHTVAEGGYPVFFFTVMGIILLTLVSNLIVIIAGHALRSAAGRSSARVKRTISA